jgi:hypothetical protein
LAFGEAEVSLESLDAAAGFRARIDAAFPAADRADFDFGFVVIALFAWMVVLGT